jgi:hypothetical protein
MVEKDNVEQGALKKFVSEIRDNSGYDGRLSEITTGVDFIHLRMIEKKTLRLALTRMRFCMYRNKVNLHKPCQNHMNAYENQTQRVKITLLRVL